MGVEIARRHGLAIISADSMQVYRGMTVGTGALTVEEQWGVPHALLGIADPREEFHAARFVAEANDCARRQLLEHGRRSLVVGGTGMWIQALREGLFPGPGRDEELRARLRDTLEREGPQALHDRLAGIDPEMATRLPVSDHVRVLRAIEVYELSGRPLSAWHAEDRQRRAGLGPLAPLVVLNPAKEVLADRITVRVRQILAAGWMEEARALLALDLPGHAPPRKALGYRELFRVIEGTLPLEEAEAAIILATTQFARRQRTWFGSQRDVRHCETGTIEEVERLLGLSE
jgi:tRNA dimethylallyltransferase